MTRYHPELTARNQWVCWRYEVRKGQQTKIPYDPRNGHRASSTNPKTWASFETARALADDYDGLGFVFAPDDTLTGIDLDHCRDVKTGAIAPWALTIVRQLDSYAEVSPSHTGIHIWVIGNVPGDRRVGKIEGHKVEMYDQERFFTVVGQHLEGTPMTINARPDAMSSLYRLVFDPEVHQNGSALNGKVLEWDGPSKWTDDEVVDRIRNSRQREKFTSLFDDGDVSDYDDDDSSADEALCCILAFWTDKDATRMDRIFRLSALMRADKWDDKRGKSTYGAITIDKANRFITLSYSDSPDRASTNDSEEPTPSTPLPVPSWPDPPGPDAFMGLAGRCVAMMSPHTEADDVALLISFLTFFGNCVGSGPHTVVGATKHGPRLFTVQVGQTSKARKGDSVQMVKALFMAAEPDWTMNRLYGGLSSGEGLIASVQDPITKHEAIKQKGRTVDYEDVVVEVGVKDKRLLVVEPEFAAVLNVMGREGNTLSTIVRDAWDNGNLRVMRKTSPGKATGAHISILGHITVSELQRKLEGSEMTNGFGNRFIFYLARRSKLLPEPEPFIVGDGHPIAYELSKTLNEARKIVSMQRSPDAREAWRAMYPDLSEAKTGFAGELKARSEAQVLRLSVIYALLDQSSTIEIEHLAAATEIWEYAERSVDYIFGDITGDQVADTILLALRSKGPLTRTQISELFGRNETASHIARGIATLESLGKVASVKTNPGGGLGRKVETWFAQ